MKVTWILVALSLLALVPAALAQNANPLAGTQWQLATIGAGNAIVDGSSVTLAFGSDDRVIGSGGCNSYGGGYSVDGDSLSFSAIFSTQRACVDNAVMIQETTYFSALGAATSYTLESDALTISYADGQALMFTKLVTLADSAWVLQSYGEETPVVAGTTVTLIFGSQNDIGGTGGCNIYGGSYATDGTTLTVSEVFSTLIACEEAILNQELAYFAALQAATGYTLDGDTLTIQYGEAQQLVFTRRAELTDGGWQLVSLGGVDVVGSAPTIEFRPDGSVGGSGGCNNYRGTYTERDGTLSLSPLASTRRACLDEAQSAQETAFFAALGSASSYTLTADQLIINDADGQQLVFAPAE